MLTSYGYFTYDFTGAPVHRAVPLIWPSVVDIEVDPKHSNHLKELNNHVQSNYLY